MGSCHNVDQNNLYIKKKYFFNSIIVFLTELFLNKTLIFFIQQGVKVLIKTKVLFEMLLEIIKISYLVFMQNEFPFYICKETTAFFNIDCQAFIESNY